MKCVKRVGYKWDGNCSNCGSVFEALRSELEILPKASEESRQIAVADCNVCKGENTITFYPRTEKF